MIIHIVKLHREISCNIYDIIQEIIFSCMLTKTDLLEYYTPIITNKNISFKDKYSKIEYNNRSAIKITVDERDGLYFIQYLLLLFNEIFEKIDNPSLFNISINILNNYDLSNIRIPFDMNKRFIHSCKSDGIQTVFKEISNIRM